MPLIELVIHLKCIHSYLSYLYRGLWIDIYINYMKGIASKRFNSHWPKALYYSVHQFSGLCSSRLQSWTKTAKDTNSSQTSSSP